jgi:hypothetical protein
VWKGQSNRSTKTRINTASLLNSFGVRKSMALHPRLLPKRLARTSTSLLMHGLTRASSVLHGTFAVYGFFTNSLLRLYENRSYMKCMAHIIQSAFLVFIRIITVLFGIGVLGCAAVLILTFVEDLRTIFTSHQ